MHGTGTSHSPTRVLHEWVREVEETGVVLQDPMTGESSRDMVSSRAHARVGVNGIGDSMVEDVLRDSGWAYNTKRCTMYKVGLMPHVVDNIQLGVATVVVVRTLLFTTSHKHSAKGEDVDAQRDHIGFVHMLVGVSCLGELVKMSGGVLAWVRWAACGHLSDSPFAHKHRTRKCRFPFGV